MKVYVTKFKMSNKDVVVFNNLQKPKISHCVGDVYIYNIVTQNPNGLINFEARKNIIYEIESYERELCFDEIKLRHCDYIEQEDFGTIIIPNDNLML